MGIKVNKDKHRVYINGKEYIILTEYNDEEYGIVLKCCPFKFEDYGIFFLIEKDGKYNRILDKEIFEKLLKKYQETVTKII